MSDAPTVLLVDDEEDVVEKYALALSDAEAEFDVRRAHDGERALATLDGTVDVVLLDRRMPGMSGSEILAEIRAAETDVRVAMLTAVDPDFDIADMDFDAYVTKPVHDAEVRAVVDQLLVLSAYDDRTRELSSVVERKSLLETAKSDEALAASDVYGRLCRRERALESDLGDRLKEMDEETFRKLFSSLPDGSADRKY
jgi:DNA-binding response OmpR family regulator